MGMFDYVNHKMVCPKCGKIINSFQSKDGPCLIEDIEVEIVDCFYGTCRHCDARIEFNRKPKRGIEDFNMTVYATIDEWYEAHYSNAPKPCPTKED